MRALPCAALSLAFIGGVNAPALAAIPVKDAAQLDRKIETSGAVIKLVPVTKKREVGNRGIKCAVTTGKKTDVADPAVKPKPGGGAKIIAPYGPDMPATPTPGATGGNLSRQYLFKETGDVASGVSASQSSVGAAQTRFQQASRQVGAAPTVMAAFDANSAAKLQNGFAWNGVIESANLWVTALNALALFDVSRTSHAASGMKAAGSSSGDIHLCPADRVGTPGAAAAKPDPACANGRYLDTNENVAAYLAGIQQQYQAASGGAAPGVTLTTIPQISPAAR